MVAAMKDDILFTLAVQFMIMSLLALGGANAVLPEVHRQVVEVGQWMSERQFADYFAIAQAAPGPNVQIVVLIGFHVGGILGATVGMLAMCGPTALLALFFARAWDRFKDTLWRNTVQAALVPISVGLVGATAVVLTRAVDTNWVTAGITAASAATALFTRWNPLYVFAVAGILSLVGLV